MNTVRDGLPVASAPAVLEGVEQRLLAAVLGSEPAPQRRAIAKTITLLESTRADHRLRADALLNALLPHTGRSFRLGISGVPGVGKSTFIEALGLHLIAQGPSRGGAGGGPVVQRLGRLHPGR